MIYSISVRDIWGHCTDSVCLHFNRRTFVIGENGCGKSSMLNILSELHTGGPYTNDAIVAYDSDLWNPEVCCISDRYSKWGKTDNEALGMKICGIVNHEFHSTFLNWENGEFIAYQRNADTDFLSYHLEPHQLGDGVNRFIAIVTTALTYADEHPDPIIAIDEPEFALHIVTQTELIKVLEQNINGQLIFFTHSPEILNGEIDNCVEMKLYSRTGGRMVIADDDWFPPFDCIPLFKGHDGVSFYKTNLNGTCTIYSDYIKYPSNMNAWW